MDDNEPTGRASMAGRRAGDPRHTGWRRGVERSFAEAAFVSENGIELEDCGLGWCESKVVLTPHHLQHTGLPHAGLIATLADHTCGGAAISVAGPGEHVLTVEFNISLLRAVKAERLHCRADVVKAGSRISFVEASVEADAQGERKLVARASATLTVMDARRHPSRPVQSSKDTP